MAGEQGGQMYTYGGQYGEKETSVASRIFLIQFKKSKRIVLIPSFFGVKRR